MVHLRNHCRCCCEETWQPEGVERAEQVVVSCGHRPKQWATCQMDGSTMQYEKFISYEGEKICHRCSSRGTIVLLLNCIKFPVYKVSLQSWTSLVLVTTLKILNFRATLILHLVVIAPGFESQKKNEVNFFQVLPFSFLRVVWKFQWIFFIASH